MEYKELQQKFNLLNNKQQQQAITTNSRISLIMAVPGSGKTTVITNRIGYLLYCCNVEPQKILTITFTNNAVSDMKKRFASTFENEYTEEIGSNFKTIHSICCEIISESKHNYEQLTTENQRKMIIEAYRKFNVYYPSNEVIQDLMQKISYCKNMCFKQPEDIINKYGRDFYDIYKTYHNLKQGKKPIKIDFDDQLTWAYQILEKNKEGIRERFQKKYEYINVDEAQDTSLIQHKIIQFLVGEKNHLFMVGDDDQSIYGFRAAYPNCLLEFEKWYVAHDTKKFYLKTNYRSTKNIVDAANEFIKTNKRVPKKMIAHLGKGEDIKKPSVPINNTLRQCYYIYNEVQDSKKEIAILYRHNISAIPLIYYLIERNIPYYCSNNEYLKLFFKNSIINDIRNFIKFSANMSDKNLFKKLSKTFFLSNDVYNKICNEMKNDETIFHSWLRLENRPKEKRKINNYILGFQKINNEATARETIDIILTKFQYKDYLKHTNKYDIQIIDAIETIASQIHGPSSLLLNEIDKLEKNIENEYLNDVNSKCILSTIHGSKGLEYEKVIIIDALKDIFPQCQNDNYEEERRMFYVAITRAKKELEIVSVQELAGKSVSISEFTEDLFKIVMNSKRFF